jgi:hypothetical protein
VQARNWIEPVQATAAGLNVTAASRTSRSALIMLWVVSVALSTTRFRFADVDVRMHPTLGENMRTREWPA